MLRRNLKNALQGFLGSFASRHSDYRGYWLLGQLPSEDLSRAVYDLLTPEAVESEVGAFARRYASGLFRTQLTRCGVDPNWVRSAALEILPTGESVGLRLKGRNVVGHRYRFVAKAETDSGLAYRSERRVEFAPHDPDREGRRGEDHWGRVPGEAPGSN